MTLIIIGIGFTVAAVLCRFGTGEAFLPRNLKNCPHREACRKEQAAAHLVFGLANLVFGLLFHLGVIGRIPVSVLLGGACLVSVLLSLRVNRKYGG